MYMAETRRKDCFIGLTRVCVLAALKSVENTLVRFVLRLFLKYPNIKTTRAREKIGHTRSG